MPVSQEQAGQQPKEISMQGNVSSTLIFFVNGECFCRLTCFVTLPATGPFVRPILGVLHCICSGPIISLVSSVLLSLKYSATFVWITTLQMRVAIVIN